MRAQPYLRTSTDDKGQDPERQMERITAWAASERVQLLPPVVDEGTSGDVEPLKRPKMQEAIRLAKLGGAEAIIVEAPDRFTREGMMKLHVSMWKLTEQYGLQLWNADKTKLEQTSFSGQLMSAIKAEQAREWLDEHRKKVKSKLDKIRCTVHGHGQLPDESCNGKHLGRKWKPFTQAEDVLILAGRQHGLGWATIALEVNKLRGALEIVTPALRRAKGTSYGAVRRRFNQITSAKTESTPLATNTPQEAV